MNRYYFLVKWVLLMLLSRLTRHLLPTFTMEHDRIRCNVLDSDNRLAINCLLRDNEVLLMLLTTARIVETKLVSIELNIVTTDLHRRLIIHIIHTELSPYQRIHSLTWIASAFNISEERVNTDSHNSFSSLILLVFILVVILYIFLNKCQ